MRNDVSNAIEPDNLQPARANTMLFVTVPLFNNVSQGCIGTCNFVRLI